MQPNPMGQGSQKDKPWPTYFIVRTTGEIVPLIAVDELPPTTNLSNVPRQLELEATIGMLNLGLQRESGAFYEIVPIEKGGVKRDRKEKCKEMEKKKETKAAPSTPPSTTTTPLPTPPATPKLPSTTIPIHTRPNPAFTNSQNHTVICRHWCTHGICKWGQQCRYKHIMPMTINGLQEVGLRDWPRWYRELNPGYFVENGGAREKEREGLKGVIGGGSGRERGGRRVGRGKEERIRERLRGLGGSVERYAIGANVAAAPKKSEELGEQILKRLRGLEREKDEKKGKEEKMKAVGSLGAGAIERGASKDVRRWEDDDSEEEEEEIVVVKEKVVDCGKGKLVDI